MENSLKNKLKYNYEQGIENPSSDLWDKLESKLEPAKDSNMAPIQAIKFNYWKYAAVILGLIALGVLFKYNFQNSSNESSSQNLTKVETPAKKEIIMVDSAKNDKKIVNQTEQIQKIANAPKQEFISTQKLDEKINKSEKLSSNPPNLIEKNDEKSESPSNIIETKNIDKPTIQKEEKQFVVNDPVNVPTNKSTTQYVKADELLFGRELQKERKQVAGNQNKIRDFTHALVEKIKPSSVTFFGVTVYSEEEKQN